MDNVNYNNNNRSNTRAMDKSGPKPELRPKPNLLIKSGKYQTEHHEKSNDQPSISRKSLSRLSSLDHMTPKVWSQSWTPKTNHEKSSVLELPSTNELPKSRFTNAWRPAPRLITNKTIMAKLPTSESGYYANQNENFTPKISSSESKLGIPHQREGAIQPNKDTIYGLSTSSEGSSTSQSKESSKADASDISKISVANKQRPTLKIDLENDELTKTAEVNENVTECVLASNAECYDEISSLRPEPRNRNSTRRQCVNRPSFRRDPKSPGFGSLKQMWADKANQSENFSPKPFGGSNLKPTQLKIETKPRASTVPSQGGVWQHVSSPSNSIDQIVKNKSEHNSKHDLVRRQSSAAQFLSPKPFRSLMWNDESSLTTDKQVSDSDNNEGNSFDFDVDIATYHAENYHGSNDSDCFDFYHYHQSSTQGYDVTQNEDDIPEEEKWQNSNASANNHTTQDIDANLEADVAVHQSLDHNNSFLSGSESYEQTTEKHNFETRETAIYHETAFNEFESPRYDSHADEAPQLPPRDEDNSNAPPPPGDASFPPQGYLPMSGRQTPDISYEDMSRGSEIPEVEYFTKVAPPIIDAITLKKREYHEIDDEVPPPPGRDPPMLPSGVRNPAGRKKSSSEPPPPLPPDNPVGRRSMIYSKEKQLSVVQGLKENTTNSAAGNNSEKRLNYIEVETSSNSNSKSNNSSPVQHRKTNYSDVIVAGSAERNRSGSCTSEESFPSSGANKKQKNMKKKLQSMLPFSKESSGTDSKNMKDSQENLAEFDKERNKKKRSSKRFLRKKTKTDLNKSKDGYIDGPRMESDSGFDYDSNSITTSSEASRSTSMVGTGSNSSGDGEVRRMSETLPNLPHSNGSDNTKPWVLPTSPSGRRKSNDCTVASVPPARSEKLYRNSVGQSDVSSTFQAYNMESPALKSFVEHDDSVPKVSSFLYEHQGKPQKSQTDPPPPPVPKRDSIHGNGRPVTPPRFSRTSSSNSLLEQSERPPVPLPGIATNQSLPDRGGSTTPLSLPVPLPSTRQRFRNSNPVPNVNVLQTEAVDGDDDCYLAAEDVPPPLPERDEGLYESINANHPVPPSPFIDSSKFLHSEPLYQIYRDRTLSHASSRRSVKARSKSAARSRRASSEWKSEFMSEELPTTTLWRSIPEVADIAATMSPEDIKLQQAQFEVITSQASYLRSINILINHFMRDWAMESTDVLPSVKRRHLFSNVETVGSIEKKFLEELERHFWLDYRLTKVCDIVTRYAKKEFNVYVLYIQNQSYQDRVLTDLQRNHEKFAEELNRLESSPACNKLPLLSFLLLPMQRVTRLPLLVTAIVNAADAVGDEEMVKKAKHTLGVVNKLVKKCNEGARKMQQTEQLAEIASQLDYTSSVKTYALISQSRSLVKKGEMNVSMMLDSKKAAKTVKLWLFLFTDVLLIAKKKSFGIDLGGSSPRYEVIDWANRQFLAVNERAVTENQIFLVILENQAGKRIEMTLMPLAQNELSRWTNALNPPTLGGTGESIYESWDCPQYICTYPYSAKQPDELSIDVGDIMQVTKKTSDGWLEGERLRDGESGWFPSSFCDEIEDEHVRSRNMKNLYRTCVG
ncbi:uncharacterized protein LOC143470233 isoform X2 [Clavelina lepadiformis]|uniref:uncharacterized protein LOC143470233 isoform X2 n=1 Tax=Clavelina lepadiformis TaxID=159417 RepID=UPI004041FEE6